MLFRLDHFELKKNSVFCDIYIYIIAIVRGRLHVHANVTFV